MKNQTIKSYLTRSTVVLGILTIAFLAVGLVSAQPKGRDKDCDAQCRKEMFESFRQFGYARAATAKYHDVGKALADGFSNTQQCVEVPGLGAMGIHFVNFERVANPNVNVTEPEALLYVPDEEGELRLVGVEYIVRAQPNSSAPTLFEREFDFDGQRNQWALHVWLWRHNPSGMFAPFNPKLSCSAN